MSFIDFIKKEKILLEGYGDFLRYDQSEPFDEDKHSLALLSANPVPYNRGKHAIFKKENLEIYGLRDNSKFIPFERVNSNSPHVTYRDKDREFYGNSTVKKGINPIVDYVMDATTYNEFRDKFKFLKDILYSTFIKVNTLSEDEKVAFAEELLANENLATVDPSKKEKGDAITERGLNLALVGDDEKEIPFSKKFNDSVPRIKEKALNNELMRLTGGRMLKRKKEEEVHKHLFEPAHSWDEETHSNFLKGHSGEHHVGEDMLNNFFEKIKDNYKDNPEEQGKLDKISKMLNSLRHNSFVGVDPDVYFKNHEDYKKKMMHILSFTVKYTADDNLRLHGKTKSISPQDVARMKRIVDDFAKHIDSGELDVDMLGEAFYAMANQFVSANEPEKVKEAFINNMAKIFAAGAEVLEDKYVLLPTAKKAHLGNKVQLLSRTGTGGEVLKKPIVIVGANRVVKRTKTRKGKGILGRKNSITGLLLSTHYHNINKEHAIASINAARYFLEALIEGDPKRANRMVLEGLKQDMSPELRTLLARDSLVSRMINEWSKGQKERSQIDGKTPTWGFSKYVMSRFEDKNILAQSGGTGNLGIAKDYMAGLVIASIRDNAGTIIKQIMKNTGVNSGKFVHEVIHLRKMLPTDENRIEFVNLIADADTHSGQSLKRVLGVILNNEFTDVGNKAKYIEEVLIKNFKENPQDMQVLVILGMIVHTAEEGAVYHQVIHDDKSKKWHSVDNYGLMDPDKQGYINKHEGSRIAGFLSHYKLGSPKDIKNKDRDTRPERFYQVGKHTVGRTTQIQRQMSQLMNKNKQTQPQTQPI